MKILCLPDGLPIDYTIQLANALSKREDVMIITCENLQSEHLENIEKKVKLHVAHLLKRPLWYPTNLIILLDTIKKALNYDPDIIHVQGGDLLTILISALHKKSILITTFHDVKPHPGWEKIMFRFIRFWFMKNQKNICSWGYFKKIMIDEFNVSKIKLKPYQWVSIMFHHLENI